MERIKDDGEIQGYGECGNVFGGAKRGLTATPISNLLDLTSDDFVRDSGADYGAGFYSYDGYHDSCFM
jgi:hypothetical protein